jgi:hypothetical protein
LRLITDDDAAPLFRSISDAPWWDGAGVEVSKDGADTAIFCLSHPTEWDRIAERLGHANVPTVVVGPGLELIAKPSQIHDIRIRPRGLGLADDVVVRDRVIDLSRASGDVLATANIAFTDLPVMRWDADR